jgi:1-acyl-sn-glycerol-3-phosphate acyltransferase
MRFIRSFLACLLALFLILLLFLPVLVMAGLFRRDAFIYAAARIVIRAALRVLGVRADVRGLDQADFSAGPVIVCNHLSNLDGPLLVSALRVNPRVLIKAEARKIPLVGWIMKLAGFVFVDRASAARRQEALAEAIAKIRMERCPFLVFPEGTRSRDGETKEFKKGGFLMALRAGVPVLPVRISGTHRLMPPGRLSCAAGRVAIDFFPLLDLAGLTESALPVFVSGVRQKIYTGVTA